MSEPTTLPPMREWIMRRRLSPAFYLRITTKNGEAK